MTGANNPLDFEFETSPSFTKKKKNALIGLDDLLEDHYKEQSKILEREAKRKKLKKSFDSEDEDSAEAKLNECVNRCQNQITKMGHDDETPLWGISIFGNQAPLMSTKLLNCELLQSFINHDVNSLVQLQEHEGESFLEGLLINGFLSKLIQARKKLDKSIAKWTFNLMLYSSNEELSNAAYNFWNSLFTLEVSSISFEWTFNYSDIKKALELYGYLHNESSTNSNVTDKVGPPKNIKSWIKLISLGFKTSYISKKFKKSEIEEILFIIITLFIDRKLVGLSEILYNCMILIINFFKNNEWISSSEKVAKSLSSRFGSDINCLRIVESISGTDTRSKGLRSKVAFQFLVSSFNNQVVEGDEILKRIMSINLKEKNCDLMKMYICIGLCENWVLFENKPVFNEMWGFILRNCSSQITGSDLRGFALKLRSKALYLLQGVSSK